MRKAATADGLDPSGATLIRHYSNAIYLVPAHNDVARVTNGGDAADRVTHSQAVTHWLTQERQFPATRPLDGANPVTVDNAVISFWAYYRSLEHAPPPTSAQLYHAEAAASRWAASGPAPGMGSLGVVARHD